MNVFEDVSLPKFCLHSQIPVYDLRAEPIVVAWALGVLP